VREKNGQVTPRAASARPLALHEKPGILIVRRMFKRAPAPHTRDREAMDDDSADKGGHIRAIGRGLAVLQAINRGRSLTMMEIAKQAGVPYPTACRIMQTLMDEGFVEKEPARKRYRPTALVRTLASGFQEDDQLVARARPLLVALGQKTLWPVALCTRVGSQMMVRDSTHAESPLTFERYYPGYTLPILECASGKAYLAFVNQAEREAVIDALTNYQGVDSVSLQLARSGRLFDDVRKQGYAFHGRQKHNATPGKTSGIAVPVMIDGRAVGALALIYFTTSMGVEEVVQRFLQDMLATAHELARELASLEGAAA
jgi:IclR family mhp operon transcriptional activator